MGMEDRDYWKERQDKAHGYVERSPLRRSLGKPPAPERGVNLLLVGIATCLICLIFYVLCKVFFRETLQNSFGKRGALKRVQH